MTSLGLDSAATATTVERAVAGDEVAFARIVAAYHLDLVRVAFVSCGDEDLADDPAQAAWWIAWRKLFSHRDLDRLKP
jgi:DNA-directed RNA polymerase specialized sigma24 family protein